MPASHLFGIALDFNVAIPKGSRVTACGKSFFATCSDLISLAGQTEINGPVEDLGAGAAAIALSLARSTS